MLACFLDSPMLTQQMDQGFLPSAINEGRQWQNICSLRTMAAVKSSRPAAMLQRVILPFISVVTLLLLVFKWVSIWRHVNQ
jgi:hypothetical protein